MKISACIIAKNEEENLPRLLESIKNRFDEIILVDTGSIDRTVEIAKSYGCRVFLHRWRGFADARNRAVKEATGDWLWHFDADFELEHREFEKALVAMKQAPSDVEAFSIGVRNLGLDGKVKAVSSHIFIHRKGIEWEGKVHESPKTEKVIGIPVFVNHYGYADPEILLKKAERNLKLLQEEIAGLPKGSQKYNFKLFFLVQTYAILSNKRRDFLQLARNYAEEFLKNASKEPDKYGFFLVFMYNYYGRILWELEDFGELKSVINDFKKRGFKLPEMSFLAYKLLKREKNREKALEELVETAVLLDRIVENPFSLKWGGVSECLPLYEETIFKTCPPEIHCERQKEIEKLWRKSGGRNLGLLVYWLTGSKKVLKKLAYKYPDDLFVHTLLFRHLVENREIEEINRFASLNIPFSWIYRAQILEWNGDVEGALRLYVNFLKQKPNAQLLFYLLKRFSTPLKSLYSLTIMGSENQKLRR